MKSLGLLENIWESIFQKIGKMDKILNDLLKLSQEDIHNLKQIHNKQKDWKRVEESRNGGELLVPTLKWQTDHKELKV